MPDTPTAPSITVAAKDIQFWANTWAQDNTFWQVSDVHPMLIKYLPKLLGLDSSTATQAQIRAAAGEKSIFVPLCGKTRDIRFLLQCGFRRVFGIEYVKKAIEELGQENEFGLQYDAKRSVFHTTDERLVIYNGDMYKCPVEEWGPFDCVWDRASFCAVEYELRPRYSDVVRRAVHTSEGTPHNFRYLLETFNYDRALFAGPPRAVNTEDIQQFWGGWAKYEAVEVVSLPEKHLMRQAMQGTPAQCMISFFTPK